LKTSDKASKRRIKKANWLVHQGDAVTDALMFTEREFGQLALFLGRLLTSTCLNAISRYIPTLRKVILSGDVAQLPPTVNYILEHEQSLLFREGLVIPKDASNFFLDCLLRR